VGAPDGLGQRTAARNDVPEGAGLCARCEYAQAVRSSRESVFVLCCLAANDARFAKYPRLPVRYCVGFELAAAS
jgi:hypothetical protein